MHDDDPSEDLLADAPAALALALCSLLLPGSGLLLAAIVADEDSVAHPDRSRLAVAGVLWLLVGVVTLTGCGLVSLASAVHTWRWIGRFEGDAPVDTDTEVDDDEVEDSGSDAEETWDPEDPPDLGGERYSEEDLTTWPRWAHDGPMGEDLRDYAYNASKAALERDLSGEDARALRSEVLVYAASNHRAQAVLWLIEHGVDLDHAVEGWGTALSVGDHAMKALLLERGADPNVPAHDTHLLNRALSGFRGDEVALLLAHGADPEGGEDPERPLLHAAWRGNTQAVEALVAAGADLSVTDAEGLTALDHARVVARTSTRREDQRLLEVLNAAGAPAGGLDALDQAVEAAFGRWFRDGWHPRTEAGAGREDGSRFGGRPWLPAGESWPVSEAGTPLSFALQLATADLPPAARAHLGAEGLLQVFFDPEDPWSGSGVRYVQPGAGALATPPDGVDVYPARQVTGWSAFREPPGPTEVSEGELPDSLDDAQEEHWDHLRRSVHVGDKLGGWPQWVQMVEYAPCGTCGRPRSHLVFQLGSEQNLREGWGDVGTAYVLACPDHPTDLGMVVQSH